MKQIIRFFFVVLVALVSFSSYAYAGTEMTNSVIKGKTIKAKVVKSVTEEYAAKGGYRSRRTVGKKLRYHALLDNGVTLYSSRPVEEGSNVTYQWEYEETLFGNMKNRRYQVSFSDHTEFNYLDKFPGEGFITNKTLKVTKVEIKVVNETYNISRRIVTLDNGERLVADRSLNLAEVGDTISMFEGFNGEWGLGKQKYFVYRNHIINKGYAY